MIIISQSCRRSMIFLIKKGEKRQEKEKKSEKRRQKGRKKGEKMHTQKSEKMPFFLDVSFRFVTPPRRRGRDETEANVVRPRSGRVLKTEANVAKKATKKKKPKIIMFLITYWYRIGTRYRPIPTAQVSESVSGGKKRYRNISTLNVAYQTLCHQQLTL